MFNNQQQLKRKMKNEIKEIGHSTGDHRAQCYTGRFERCYVRPICGRQQDQINMGTKGVSQAWDKHPMYASNEHQFILIEP